MNAKHYENLAERFPLHNMQPIGGRMVYAVKRLTGLGDGAGLALIYHVLTETLAGQVVYVTDDKGILKHIQYQASVMIGCGVMGVPGNILFIYARNPVHAENQLRPVSNECCVFLDPELGLRARSESFRSRERVIHIDAELL